jgi:hypothetical protein
MFSLLLGSQCVDWIKPSKLFEKSTGKKLDVLWAEFVAMQVKVATPQQLSTLGDSKICQTPISKLGNGGLTLSGNSDARTRITMHQVE